MKKELLFSDIVYINLDSRLDRKAEFNEMILKTFFQAKVDVHRISGVQLTLDEIQEHYINDVWITFKNPVNNKNPYVGEIGCALSHIKAWEKVVELDRDCLIMEDDAVPINEETCFERNRVILHDQTIMEDDAVPINEETCFERLRQLSSDG